MTTDQTTSHSSTEDWRAKAANKRAELASLIPSEWRIRDIATAETQPDVTGTYIHQFLTSREIEITETDAVGIVAKTTTGQWTAVEVVKAFCHRAALAHQLVNCLHEIFFEAALKDAEALDEFFGREGKPMGPLHGLPVSLKDQFHVKGVNTSMGYVGWLDTFEGKKDDAQHLNFESEMVKSLRSLGAVLYVKTSVPHTLMCGETINNIIGETVNPRNRLLSSGGSSGGEGALIGIRGSPLGFGSDIGGSVRFPAVFQGLFSLRPSSGRLPYQGTANSMDGQITVPSVLGPLATSLGSLRLAMEAVLHTEPWLHDPMVIDMPWREEKVSVSAKLCFGVLWHDGGVSLTPPVHRALEMAVEAVKRAGHTVIEWKPSPPHSELNTITNKAYSMDGNKDLNDAMDLAGEPLAARLVKAWGTRREQMKAHEIAALNVRKRTACKQYMEYWNQTAEQTGTGRPVDAVISPVAPFPGARPASDWYYGYANWVNCLDYSSVVIPVTMVDQRVDVVNKEFKPLSKIDQKIQDSYDPELFHGAPVGVQIVGRRLHEERTLVLAEAVFKSLRVEPSL